MDWSLVILFPFWSDKAGNQIDYPPEKKFFLGQGVGGEIQGVFNLPSLISTFNVTRNIWIR